MKKIIAFVLLSFSLSILVSAQALPKKTKISGQLKDNATFTEITVRLPTQDVNIIATSKVEADGKFSLEFSQLETNIYKIFLADNNQIMLILTPGDQVIANLTAVNLGQNPDITGSTETTKLLVAQAKLNEYTHQLDVVNSSWKESMTSPKADSIQAILRAQYEKFSNGQNAFLKDAVAQNKFSLIGLFFIERLDISDDFPTYDLYDQAVMQRYSNNNFIKDFHGRVESERRISLGSMAPDLKFPNPEGVMHSLSELKGKVVLVDFWASWCGPCRKENPHVLEMYKKYNAKGFEVLGVSLDRDKDAWIKGIKDDGLVWTQISDVKYWKSDAAKLYNVTAIPFTVLVDRDGKIIGKKLRGEVLSEELKKIFGY